MEIANLPRHVAFILDGNGRWAEKRNLLRLEGHRAGVANIRPIIKYLSQLGIKYTTLYAFSTENWNRPADEVSGLLRLLQDAFYEEAAEFHKYGVKIRHLGRTTGLSDGLQDSISKAVKLTENNTGMNLGVAFNYGGRTEIIDAVRRLIDDVVSPDKIDEKLFEEYLYTAGIPHVDLVIRTGGEIRTSNFLIWQAAYSEYYFTPVLWPDFNEKELEKALYNYSQRQRRFGGLIEKAKCSEKDS
jgi:undecaprenyl diphosphate synthase